MFGFYRDVKGTNIVYFVQILKGFKIHTHISIFVYYTVHKISVTYSKTIHQSRWPFLLTLHTFDGVEALLSTHIKKHDFVEDRFRYIGIYEMLRNDWLNYSLKHMYLFECKKQQVQMRRRNRNQLTVIKTVNWVYNYWVIFIQMS